MLKNDKNYKDSDDNFKKVVKQAQEIKKEVKKKIPKKEKAKPKE
jgi:formiminotetrahydrofolate cyclodeaminase